MSTFKHILCRYLLINSKTFEIQKFQNSRVSFIWNAETRQPSFTCFMHKIPSKAFLVSILVSASQALKYAMHTPIMTVFLKKCPTKELSLNFPN